MPFIGQDWRSPGEVWIKTDEGWERMKLLRKSHLLRHQSSIENGASGLAMSPTGSLSSSPGSAISLTSSSSSSSGSESDSDVESVSIGERISPAPPANGSTASLGNDFLDDNNSYGSFADILQRLQKSSSQPIPNDILKESSDLIESHYVQPFCRITLNPTKEVAGSNIISEAFYRLDFCNAIRDIRRFAYVSKLLHLLITQNLTSLSGNATKALFWMLEEIAKQVATNKQNIHVIRELLVELREIVDKYLCWGRPLGSTALWEQHLRTMERICEMTDAIQIESPEDKDKPSWNDLPEELIREILLRLSDYKDLERSAEACERMNLLLNEERHIWKQLCKYHFTKDQMRWANQLATNANHAIHTKIYGANSDIVDWEQMFHLLRKKFGLKEEYADCLFLCRYCRCLFWKSKGHPCILENPDLTRQLTTSVSNVSSSSKSEIIASLRKKSSPLFVSATCSPNTNVLGANRTRNHSSPNSQNPSHLSNISPLRPVQHHQIPLGPVAVQNIPFFEHPLVLQQQRRQEQNRDDANNNVRQQQQQRQPFENIRQRFQNAQNGNVPQREQQEANNVSAFPKAPLYIPITPHAFLKFFSL